ncbi:MAG: FecR domain-containing protein [Geobacteraceae bacterium]|nr:FecR domain-containing protein [Geobacteraceae bacterium]
MIKGKAGRGVFAYILLLMLAVLLMTPDRASATKVEVRKVLDTSPLNAPFVYDVGPEGAVLVLTRDNIYDAGAREFLFGEPLKNPGWLAFAGDKLHFISNGGLFAVDGGMPRKLIDVPLKSRIFVSDSQRTYIGGVTAAGKPVLFIYKEGVGHKALLELDAPIDAMALAQGKLFFTVGPRIYVLAEGGDAKLFVHLPGFLHIPSIAVDDRHGLLYFSDGDNIYAVRDNDFVVVRRGVGGMLRCREGDLYILSWRDHTLFRMHGLPEVLSSAGGLVPLNDPCKTPVLSIYCQAEKKRALLKSLAKLEGSVATGNAGVTNEFADYTAGQKKELEQIMAQLELEALVGVEAVLWGGGTEPKAINRHGVITTEGKGVALTLWDGSETRIGPNSKMVVDDCRPSRECSQILEKGLLYFESYKQPVEGMSVPKSSEFVIATAALNLKFGPARLVVYASGDKTSIVVLEGQVQGVTPGGDSVTVASGETLEVKRGERAGIPRPAEMGRLKKWWEVIR